MSTVFDWRNQRPAMAKAAAPTAVDKEALEKAFMDQAYGYVSNRAGELFADPYRLGFEVVFANESSTRMVGIFAFRLRERLLYAPVFFIQGEIKGYDMAYRHWVKKFCPFTPEWTKFLLETAIQDVGRGVDRQEVGRINDNVHLERLAAPPDYFKQATVKGDEFEGYVKSAFERYRGRDLVDGWDPEFGHLVNDMAKQAGMPEPILKGFLEKAPADLLEKVASTLQILDPLTLDALLKNAADGTWEFVPEPVEKQASAAEPDLLFLRAPVAGMAADDYQHFCTHGYWMQDKRAAESKSTLEKPITNDSSIATGIPGFGTFRMLMPGGEFRRVVAAPYDYNSDFGAGSHPNVVPSSFGGNFPNCRNDTRNGNYDAGGPREIVIIDVESKHSMRWTDVGNVTIDETSEVVDQVEGAKVPTKGKAYRVHCPCSGILSKPFVVENIESASDGVKIIEASGSYDSDKFMFTLNPDSADSSLRDNLLNGKCRFFEVALDKKVKQYEVRFPETKAMPGSLIDLQNWAMDAGGKKVTVKKEAGLYTVGVLGTKRAWMDLERHEAHMLLAGMQIDAKSAAAWLDEPGERLFFSKNAYATQLTKEPDFRVGRDGTFGVEVEMPYNEMLPTRTEQVQHPSNRIGDAHDPSMGRGPTRNMERMPDDLILSSAPEVLAQMAKSWKVPHVLEHGAVGSLARTYDSLQLIESYIPPMEECLDRLARCLFLYYLKPQDFEKAYGSDDMASQENDFLNAFRVLGDLVLSLLRRSRGPSESQGSPVDRM